ncbi:hypothetical protein [Streptomyces sp. NPDC002133]|uniref:hypothetical protein n=1 Tax=Streptomyces sp. NPDC002133 TaxID=3154409 RepID=UPI0033183288
MSKADAMIFSSTLSRGRCELRPCVVHDDVDAALLRVRLCRRAVDGLRVGDVRDDGEHVRLRRIQR